MTPKERIEQIKERAKTLGLALAFSLGGKSAAAKTASAPQIDPNIAPSGINVIPEQDNNNDSLLVEEQQLAIAQEEFSATAQKGTYKGISINYAKAQAQDIGHVFESGMNPTAYTGRYIGWYQMSLTPGGLMHQFVRTYGNKYPNLRGKGLTSPAFRKAYNAYVTGKDKAAIEKDLFSFNYDKVYANIFNKLADNVKDFPRITKENCNDPQYKALAGAIMSCANQNPAKTPEIFAAAWNKNLNKGKFAPEDAVSATEFYGKVIETSYDIRQSRWNLRTRYAEERKLAAGINNFNIALLRIEKARALLTGVKTDSTNITPAKGNQLNLAYVLKNQREK